MTVPQIIVCVFVVAPLVLTGFVLLVASAFPPPQDDDAICAMLGIGGGELRNLRETHGERNTIA